MSPEPQDAFAEAMKGEVYSSCGDLSTSPPHEAPGLG
jgi:hypothetical protein